MAIYPVGKCNICLREFEVKFPYQSVCEYCVPKTYISSIKISRNNPSDYLIYISTPDWSFKVRVFPEFAIEQTGNPSADQVWAEYRRLLLRIEMEEGKRIAQNFMDYLQSYQLPVTKGIHP